MVLFMTAHEDDSLALRELRGVMHFILLEAGECCEKLKACQPELNWSKGTFNSLPLSEFLLCSSTPEASIASAKSTQHVEWVESLPTIKNMTEVWGAIIMHMTDWSGCNIGTIIDMLHDRDL